MLYATFFDLLQDASLDILLVTKNDDGETSLQALYNNMELNNFFIRMKMITDELVASPINSASFRCVVTQLNDRKIIVQGGHTSQSAFHALNQPISSIGVGVSNNFIEQFSVGVFVDGERVLRTWTPVIPKSTLFVITDMSKDEQNWNLTLMLNPTDKVPLILVVDGLFLLVLGLFIIILHMYEVVSNGFVCVSDMLIYRPRMQRRRRASRLSTISETDQIDGLLTHRE